MSTSVSCVFQFATIGSGSPLVNVLQVGLLVIIRHGGGLVRLTSELAKRDVRKEEGEEGEETEGGENLRVDRLK